MKFFLLIFFFLSIRVWAQTLPPGTYHNLSFPQPMVLDTGTYIFIHLEMKNLGEGIWLDARNATKLTLTDCSFEGTGKAMALLTSGNVVVNHCHFRNMEQGIRAEAESGKTVTVQITQNTFTDLGTSISLTKSLLRLKESSLLGRIKNTTLPEGNKWIDNGTSIQLAKKTSGANAIYDFTLKCNQFKLSCADGPNATATSCDGEPLRKGIVIGEGVRVKAADVGISFDNQIGGVGSFDATNPLIAYPNANEWPVKYYPSPPFTRASFPVNSTGNIQMDWERPVNWISMDNNTNNPSVIYRRYNNEFVWNASDENSQISTFPTGKKVKTSGTNTLTGVDYEPTCDDYITTNDPIFPGRIAVLADSIQSVISKLNPLNSGLHLGDAIPNPAQQKTSIFCQIPQNEPFVVIQLIEISTGRILHSKALSERGQLKIDLDLTRFPAGIYGYQLILEKVRLGAKRFIVVK